MLSQLEILFLTPQVEPIYFLKLNHCESKLTSVKWIRNKHLIQPSNIFLCCPLAVLTSKNNQQHQHNTDTHQLCLWDTPRYKKQLFCVDSPRISRVSKNQTTITVKHIGNASDNLGPTKKPGLKNYWPPLKAIALRGKTQSECYWVWGEVLTPKVSRPWKQPIKCRFYEVSLQEASISYSPHGKWQMASTKGRVFAIMC